MFMRFMHCVRLVFVVWFLFARQGICVIGDVLFRFNLCVSSFSAQGGMYFVSMFGIMTWVNPSSIRYSSSYSKIC